MRQRHLITPAIITRELMRLSERKRLEVDGLNDIRQDTTHVFISGKEAFQFDNSDLALSLDDFSAKYLVPASNAIDADSPARNLPHGYDWSESVMVNEASD